MARIGSVASGGGGRFRWRLGERRISFGDGFEAWSPRFTFSDIEYDIRLLKVASPPVILTAFHRPNGAPLPMLPIEFELLADSERASRLCSVTARDESSNYVLGAMSIRRLLFRRTDRTFDGPLVLSFRFREETRGFKKLREDFGKLLSSGKNCDVTLKVQDKKFPAHRAILRARSPVFEAMFTHDMEEKHSSNVVVEDCDPKTFHLFLRYLYTGSTEHVNQQTVRQLYTTPDKYTVLSLKAKCVEFMKSHVSVETFCDFFTLALMHAEEGLLRSATEFFCANAAEIGKTAKWQIFLAENLTVGNDLFLKAVSRGKII